MKIIIADNKFDLGIKAAEQGAAMINQAIMDHGKATIIIGTGASQFEMLARLIDEKIDWTNVIVFHLDEYIGIPITHPASFRKFLKERFLDKLPVGEFHYVNGEADPKKECVRLGEIISGYPVDVAFIGIGENGHIAFNDPPLILKQMLLLSGLSWMRPAVASKPARDGLRQLSMFHQVPLLCR